MGDRIFLSLSDVRAEFFRWSDGRLIQALREKPGTASRVGAVYLGRVGKVDKSLNAAFVELGLERPGMLPLKAKGSQPSEGDAILVQVRRDGREEKGVRVSRTVRAQENVTSLAKDCKPPALLLAAPTLWQNALMALDADAVAEIVCDRRVDVEAIAGWCRRYNAGLAAKVTFVPARDWQPGRAETEEEIGTALEEEVPLPGGGSLLVEPVRTLTAIDVNSGSASGEGGMDRTALSVNLAAAREIPRQLCLRNLGGIVVVDFIDIENHAKRVQVVEALRAAAAIDSAIAWIGNMSRLGLVEMQRKRTGPTLRAMWEKGDDRA